MAAMLQVKMAAIKIRDDLSDLEGPGEAFIFEPRCACVVKNGGCHFSFSTLSSRFFGSF